MDRRFAPLLLLTCITAASLLVPGCDTSVDMVRPSDQAQYSLYGTLDVTADTQVIRVEPLGDSTQLGARANLEASVILEHLGTGTQVALQDSFMSVGNEDHMVHNFWTTHPIETNSSYQIRVERNGQTQTFANAKTPEPPNLTHDSTFYLPCCYSPSAYVRPDKRFITFTVRVQNEDASQVAAAYVNYDMTPSVRQTSRFDITDSTTQENGRLQIAVPYKEHLQKLNPQSGDKCAGRKYFQREMAQVEVSVGGPNWPDWLDASLEDLARPNSFSNVENGHGFVGAAYTETVSVQIRDRPVGAGCPGPSQEDALETPLLSSAFRPSCNPPQRTRSTGPVRRGTWLQQRDF